MKSKWIIFQIANMIALAALISSCVKTSSIDYANHNVDINDLNVHNYTYLTCVPSDIYIKNYTIEIPNYNKNYDAIFNPIYDNGDIIGLIGMYGNSNYPKSLTAYSYTHNGIVTSPELQFQVHTNKPLIMKHFTPILFIAGDVIIVSTIEPCETIALSKDTLKQLWIKKDVCYSNVEKSLIRDGSNNEYYLILSGRANNGIISCVTGTEYTFQNNSAFVTKPVINDGFVYFLLEDIIGVFSLHSNEMLWSRHFSCNECYEYSNAIDIHLTDNGSYFAYAIFADVEDKQEYRGDFELSKTNEIFDSKSGTKLVNDKYAKVAYRLHKQSLYDYCISVTNEGKLDQNYTRNSAYYTYPIDVANILSSKQIKDVREKTLCFNISINNYGDSNKQYYSGGAIIEYERNSIDFEKGILKFRIRNIECDKESRKRPRLGSGDYEKEMAEETRGK